MTTESKGPRTKMQLMFVGGAWRFQIRFAVHVHCFYLVLSVSSVRMLRVLVGVRVRLRVAGGGAGWGRVRVRARVLVRVRVRVHARLNNPYPILEISKKAKTNRLSRSYTNNFSQILLQACPELNAKEMHALYD